MSESLTVISISNKSFEFNLNKLSPKKIILVHDCKHLVNIDSKILKSRKVINLVTGKNIGSYSSRNKALECVDQDDLVLMIDDDVTIDSFPLNKKLKKDTLYVPNIRVIGECNTLLQLWYKYNAFDQKKFIKRYKFAPTICWFFKFKKISFADAIFTGGDMQASKQFKELLLLSDFRISTKIRTDIQIKLKFNRQASGHVKKTNFIELLAYIFKNIFIGNGLKFSLVKKYKFKYVLSCYLAGYLKSFYFIKHYTMIRLFPNIDHQKNENSKEIKSG